MTPKEIADALDRAALGDPETDAPRSRKPGKEHLAEFNFDGHIVRCLPTAEAIRKVARKYRKKTVRLNGGAGVSPQSYNVDGVPTRSHNVDARWFSHKRLPLHLCGE